MTTALVPSSSLSFQDVSVSIYDDDGCQWVTMDDVARCLYDERVKRNVYTFRQSLFVSYRRNKDEFDDDMTAIITIQTAGGPQQTRVFSLRGAHLLGMLAKTEKAKLFRRWVLDMLEGVSVATSERVKELEVVERERDKLLLSGTTLTALTPKERSLLESVSSWAARNIIWGAKPAHRDNASLIHCGYNFRDRYPGSRRDSTKQEFGRVFLVLARKAAIRDGLSEDAYVVFSRSGKLVGWVCAKRLEPLDAGPDRVSEDGDFEYEN